MSEVFAGRYELLEPVAEGGMGTVWTTRDLTTDSVLAAKVLRSSDADGLLRFVREQGVRIDHPHVLTPISWAGDDDRVLFTMPLVRGGSVANLLGDFHRLPPRWVVALLDQTLDALGAVHASGLVHRDVKPGNLLLHATGGERPHLMLSDFGIAAPVDGPRLTRASQVVGSPGYLSPDQARGADPSPSHDLYSVGMVGLEMLCGEPPPRSLPGARSLARDHPGLTSLVDLLARAVSDDPSERPASAEELRHELSGLRVPESDAEEPFVFNQVELEVPAAPPAQHPVAGPVDGTSETNAPAPGRAAAYALIATGVLCALAAIGVLLWL